MRHSQKHKNVIFNIKIANIITNKIKYIGYIKMINNTYNNFSIIYKFIIHCNYLSRVTFYQ